VKITAIHAYRKNLALSKPYTIARHTISDVENIFLEITLDNGLVGIGAASPAEEVVGETCEQTFQNCRSDFFQHFVGRDIRHFHQLIEEANVHFPNLPGTQAAFDIAAHDAFCQYLGIPIVEFYGQKITSMPTSVTIGIMPLAETLFEAEQFERLGFKILKVKTGLHPEEDVERILKLRERFKHHFTIRVDANQGYSLSELNSFLAATKSADIELIEQPLLVGKEAELLSLEPAIRKKLAADESLKTAAYALKFAQEPTPFGIFNIKLMKCGGIAGALEIATIARNADIDLFWGCNDESIVSITAALHAAFACKNTRYIDLDGSFDLAEDIVTGGFVLKNGCLELSGKAGLGVVKMV
jgi:L-alanine-DL-glutamate epimerase-like enolase superfamily enzyme